MAVVNKYKHTPDENTVYIGRGSKWGNPFVMRYEKDRESVCRAHAAHLDKQIASGEITTEELAALHGKDLMCYCAPKRCHGDYLAQVARRAFDQIQADKPMTLVNARVDEPVPEQFNLIVAGGRDFTDQDRVRAEMFAYAEAMGEGKEISVISGMARGADLAAYWVCKAEGIHCIEMPADWTNKGKAAGFIGNRAMGVQAHGLLAFWDGRSKGTKHMIDTMRAMGKHVHVVTY